MESLTYLKNQSITPKKLRMFLSKIKKLSPVQATNVLYYSPNRAAQVFYKAIKSAIANAKQTLKVNDDLLQFKLFTIEEGNKLKRYQAGSRGNAKPFRTRYSHIKIILVSKTQPEAEATLKARPAAKAQKVTVSQSAVAESDVSAPKVKSVKAKSAKTAAGKAVTKKKAVKNEKVK